MIPRTGIAVSKKELLFILLVFIVYVVMGGTVFMLLESPREEQLRMELTELRVEFQEKLDLLEVNSNLSRADMEQLMRRLALIRSTSFLNDEPSGNDTHTNWSFDNSFFFAITVVTTIGYGHLAPSTTSGRLFCVMYATVGIPLTGILLAAIGGHYSQHLVRQLQKVRQSKNPRLSQLLMGLTCLLPWLFVFLVFPTVLFMFTEGWSFLEGFYYCFITLSTIGFGDYVAGNFKKRYIWLYKLIVLMWIIFGLGHLAMILNYISRAMRCKKLRKMERKLSKNFHHTQQRMGQRIEGVIQDISRQRSFRSRGRNLKRTQSSLSPAEAKIMMKDQNHNSSSVSKPADQDLKPGEIPHFRPRRYSLPFVAPKIMPDVEDNKVTDDVRGSLNYVNEEKSNQFAEHVKYGAEEGVRYRNCLTDGRQLVPTLLLTPPDGCQTNKFNNIRSSSHRSIIDMDGLQATRV